MLDDENEDTKEGILHTPINQSGTPHLDSSDSAQKTDGSIFGSRKQLELVTPFGQRKNKFVVQFSLNEPSSSTETIKQEINHEASEDDIIKRVQPSKRCSIHINSCQPEIGCRFMYDRIEAKVPFSSLGMKCSFHSLV